MGGQFSLRTPVVYSAESSGEDYTLMGLNTVMLPVPNTYSGLTAHIAIDGSWGDPYSYWGTPSGITNARYYTRSENAVSVKALCFKNGGTPPGNAWLPVNVSIEYFDGTDWAHVKSHRTRDQRLADVPQQHSRTGRVLASQF